MHCGLCLESCPTYRETGREISSPRGRIYLMRGVAEGRIPLGDVVAEEAYLCLGCRACETACPSGVEFGAMLELTRAEVEDARLRRGFAKTLERFALRHVVPHPRRLRLLVDLLALAQRLRLDRLALALAPRALRELADLLPAAPARSARRSLPELVPARGRAARPRRLLRGLPDAGALRRDQRATPCDVLAHNGFDVVIPREQGCCGALHAHAGDEAFAHALARRNVAAFARAGVREVVVNSAGCGAALRDAARWLGAEGEALARRRDRRVELSCSARACGPSPGASTRACVTTTPATWCTGRRSPRRRASCSSRSPGSRSSRTTIRRAAAARPASTTSRTARCRARCSSASCSALAAADPDVIATGNPGCLMQLRSGVARAGLRAEVLHPVEILARAYFSSGVSRPSRRIL